MKKPKFKIGDKVKVLRASTDEEEYLWMDVWVHEMNNNIGNSYTITCCINNEVWQEGATYPKYKLDNPVCYKNFPEFVLQKDVAIGRQLLFDFMRE